MAGLPMSVIEFPDTPPPPLALIGALVQERGGVPVEARLETFTLAPMAHSTLHLQFMCIPGKVEVRALPGGRSGLSVTDRSLEGGTLYRLVNIILVEAGGVSQFDVRLSLKLPLTEAGLIRERRRRAFQDRINMLMLAVVALGIVAGLGCLLCKIIESLF